MLAQPVTLGLLADHIIDSVAKPRIEDNILQDVARLAEFYDAFQFAAGLGELEGDARLGRGACCFHS